MLDKTSKIAAIVCAVVISLTAVCSAIYVIASMRSDISSIHSDFSKLQNSQQNTDVKLEALKSQFRLLAFDIQAKIPGIDIRSFLALCAQKECSEERFEDMFKILKTGNKVQAMKLLMHNGFTTDEALSVFKNTYGSPNLKINDKNKGAAIPIPK